MKSQNEVTEQLQCYYKLWRESYIMYEEWAKKQEMSLNTLLILYSFYENGDVCTQKQISKRWLIPKQTVNAVLKDFEKKEYIKLIPVESDKRNKKIQLTPSGNAFAHEVITKLHDRELYVMEQMGLEAIKEMNVQLGTFVNLFRTGGSSENE